MFYDVARWQPFSLTGLNPACTNNLRSKFNQGSIFAHLSREQNSKRAYMTPSSGVRYSRVPRLGLGHPMAPTHRICLLSFRIHFLLLYGTRFHSSKRPCVRTINTGAVMLSDSGRMRFKFKFDTFWLLFKASTAKLDKL